MDLAKRAVLLGILGLSPFILGNGGIGKGLYEGSKIFDGLCSGNNKTYSAIIFENDNLRAIVMDLDGISKVRILSERGRIMYEREYKREGGLQKYLEVPIRNLGSLQFMVQVEDGCGYITLKDRRVNMSLLKG